MRVKVRLKHRVLSLLPISARKHAAVWIGKQRWLPDSVAIRMISDIKHSDPKGFHKFLWSHHIGGYAKWYDSAELFNEVKMNGSVKTREEFFHALFSTLKELGLDPARDILSVLEVGCSLGYLLRYMERECFPDAEELVGVDIDRSAIEKGARYLASAGSRVRLIQGDMEELDHLFNEHTFDFVLASGVLSYLNSVDATQVVATLLNRTNKILGLLGLAYETVDNNDIPQSLISSDHNNQWLHNFKTMVEAGGGRVVFSRWKGADQPNSRTIYFVFAVPGKMES